MSEIPSEEIEELLNGFKSQETTQNEVSPTEEVHIDEDDLREIEEKLEQQDLADSTDPDNLDFINDRKNQFNKHSYLLASVEILLKERDEMKRKTGTEQNTPQTIKFVAHMMLELSLIKYQVNLTKYLSNYNEDQIRNLSLDLHRVKELIDFYNVAMPRVMKNTFKSYFEDIKTDFVDTEENLSDVSTERLRESIRKSRITLYKMYLEFGQNLLEAVALRYLYNVMVLPVHFNDYFGDQYLLKDVKHNYPITFTENNKTYMNIALFPGFFKQEPDRMTDSLTTDRFGEFFLALQNIDNHLEAVAMNGWTNVLKGFFSKKKLELNENVRTVIDYVNKLDEFVSSMDDVKNAHAKEKKPRPVRQTRRKVVKIEDVIEVLPQIMTRLKQYKNLQKFFPKK